MLNIFAPKKTYERGGENNPELSKEMGYGMSENITRGNLDNTSQEKEKR